MLVRRHYCCNSERGEKSSVLATLGIQNQDLTSNFELVEKSLSSKKTETVIPKEVRKLKSAPVVLKSKPNTSVIVTSTRFEKLSVRSVNGFMKQNWEIPLLSDPIVIG